MQLQKHVCQIWLAELFEKALISTGTLARRCLAGAQVAQQLARTAAIFTSRHTTCDALSLSACELTRARTVSVSACVHVLIYCDTRRLSGIVCALSCAGIVSHCTSRAIT